MWRRDILTLAGFNYFYYAVMAIFVSYLPVVFAHKGISPAEIGLLLGLGPIISIVAPPLWGYLSDRWQNTKKVLLLVLGGTVLFGAILFASSAFWLLFLLVMISFFFLSPIGPLTESLNYRLAEVRGVSYGTIRLFGSIGYGTTALAVGFAAQQWGMGTIPYLYLGYGVLALLLCLLLVNERPLERRKIVLRELVQFITYKPTLWFLLIVLLLSIPHRTNDNFLGVYIQQLGGSTGLVGQAWFYATMSEAVCFGLAFFWLRKGKELELLLIAAAFYVLRYLLCAWLAEPHWIAWLQWFHGLTFAIFYSAAIQYLYRIAPEQWKATSQTVFAAIFFGLSGMIGSVLGGWLLSIFGGMVLYIVMALISFAGFSLILLTLSRRHD